MIASVADCLIRRFAVAPIGPVMGMSESSPCFGGLCFAIASFAEEVVGRAVWVAWEESAMAASDSTFSGSTVSGC